MLYAKCIDSGNIKYLENDKMYRILAIRSSKMLYLLNGKTVHNKRFRIKDLTIDEYINKNKLEPHYVYTKQLTGYDFYYVDEMISNEVSINDYLLVRKTFKINCKSLIHYNHNIKEGMIFKLAYIDYNYFNNYNLTKVYLLDKVYGEDLPLPKNTTSYSNQPNRLGITKNLLFNNFIKIEERYVLSYDRKKKLEHLRSIIKNK